MTVTFTDIHQIIDPNPPPPNNTVCENCDTAFINGSHVLLFESSYFDEIDGSWLCLWSDHGDCEDAIGIGYDLYLYIGTVDPDAHCLPSQYFIKVNIQFHITNDLECGCQGIYLQSPGNFAAPEITWISCYNNPITCYNLNRSLDYFSHTENEFDEGCLGLIAVV